MTQHNSLKKKKKKRDKEIRTPVPQGGNLASPVVGAESIEPTFLALGFEVMNIVK
jgi:hypothetical protein